MTRFREEAEGCGGSGNGGSTYFIGNLPHLSSKMCLFPELGDLIFARHGTVLASKAKHDAPTEGGAVYAVIGTKRQDRNRRSWEWIVHVVLTRVGDLAASRVCYSPSL